MSKHQHPSASRPSDPESALPPSRGSTAHGRRWSQRQYWALLLVFMVVVNFSVRGLSGLGLDHSALLYIALPSGVALVLLLVPRASSRGYWGLMRGAAIVLLGSSVILQEGFLCVLLLAPIYFLMVSLAYLIVLQLRRNKGPRHRLNVSVLPALLLLGSLEGVAPATTLPRAESVQLALQVPMTVAEVRHRLLAPRLMPASSDWLLRLFPMPYRIDVPGTEAGAVHEVFFEYRRWIVTNVKRGSMRLRLDEVGERQIVVSVSDDSSYLSTYLRLEQTRIDMQPLADGGTRVQLTIRFERRLDPAWYFQPMQRYAVEAMGMHILQHQLNEERRHDG